MALDELAVRKRIIKHFREEVDFDAMPEEAWELLDKRLTLGIFQIESGKGAKRLAAEIKPRSVEDLAVLSALNRPGPLRSGDTERYLARRAGREGVTYPHEILEEILAPTLGIFLFQEEAIAYFRAIGYDLSEADQIRKIIGKKLVSEMADELPRYLERAQKFMSEQDARAIWNLIVNFSKYAFNKPHAIAYGMITAWTIYCKWRWKLEFYMASIEKNPKKVGAYVDEARHRGIRVLAPDVNQSGVVIGKAQESIVYGLSDIKGVKSAAANIVSNQPYESPEDFIDRSEVNAGVKKLILRAGACDSFGYRLEVCPDCEGKGRVPEMIPKKSGDGLKRVLVDCKCHAGWIQSELPSIEEKLAAEQELLQITLTDEHVRRAVEQNKDRVEKSDSWDLLTDDKSEWPQEGTWVAKIKDVRKTKVSKPGKWQNHPMGHITLMAPDYTRDDLSVVVWPPEWADFNWAFKPERVGEFTLKGQTDKRGEFYYKLVKSYIYVDKEEVE